MRKSAQREWLPWISIALLFVLCGFLAILQYRWIGEITIADRARLQEELQSRLTLCVRNFNDAIFTSLRALYPNERENTAWTEQYLRWRNTHGPLFTQAGIEVRTDSGYQFYQFDLTNGQLTTAPRLDDRDPRFFELGGGPDVPDHLLVLLNLDYIRSTVAPETIASNLRDYDVEIASAGNPSQLIYSSQRTSTEIWDNPDASIPLLDLRFAGGFGRRGPGAPPPFFRGRGPGPGPAGNGPGLARGPEPTRWRLLARHKSGSLEALVARTQKRNLAVSGAVLLLILGTVAMLIRYSRQAQRLAEMQMDFVAGVSHELRTPLTVIRTAAYNLRSPSFRRSEEHVERYGRIIEAESGRLDGLVEQVLTFAGAQAGHAVRSRESVNIAALVESEIVGLRGAIESRGVAVHTDIDADLPHVTGDLRALHHAFRNLLDNALKHGTASEKWIGVTATAIDQGKAVEIRVADRGPGIPSAEKKRIFEAFVRGRRALSDQIRGTGLGLNLVKTIVEAHSGTVEVSNRPEGGAEFIIRIPSAETSA